VVNTLFIWYLCISFVLLALSSFSIVSEGEHIGRKKGREALIDSFGWPFILAAIIALIPIKIIVGIYENIRYNS
jgi:hypothetical protein